MHRKATFKLFATRREMLYVGDQPDHNLMLMEMEGEPVDYSPREAGKFVHRRSVGFHDRTKGEGPMHGYAWEGGSSSHEIIAEAIFYGTRTRDGGK